MLENNFPEQKRLLIEEIETYCSKSKRLDDKLMLKCLKEIKNLTTQSLKDLSPIRFHKWGIAKDKDEKGRRPDIFGLWLLNRIDKKHQQEAFEVYNYIISIPLGPEYKDLKVDGLNKLLEMAKVYRLEENENEPLEEKKLNLPDVVYRFYRYHSTKSNVYLDSSGFQILKLLRGLSLNEKEKITLITALCQSGKTFLVIPLNNIYLSLGMTTVMLTLNRTQSGILRKRILQDSKELCAHLESLGFSQDEVDMFRQPLYFDCKNPLKKKDDRLKLAMNGEKRRTIICAKHNVQLSRIRKLWTEESNLCIFGDEAHQSCAYKTKHSNHENKTGKYDLEVVELKNKALKFVPITGSPQDIIMVEKNLYTDNVVYIEPGQYFSGPESLIWKTIDTKNTKKDDAFPKYLNDVLVDVSKQEPIERYDRRFGKIDKHPHVVMVRTDRLIENHKEVLTRFMDGRLPKEILDGNWAIMTDHGEGIHLWHSSLADKKIKISGIKSKRPKSGVPERLLNNIHYFPTHDIENMVDISDVLQYLGEKGIEKFPRILVLAYDMCRESVSFVSHYHKSENIHLTCGIYDFNSTTNVETIIQAIGRLNGNHGDNIRPIVYASQSTREKYIKGIATLQFQIRKILKAAQRQNTLITPEMIKSTPEFLEDLEIKENLVPKNYNKIKNLTIKTVNNPNAEKENNILKKDNLNTIEFLVEADKYGWKKSGKKLAVIKEEAQEKLGIESEDEKEEEVNKFDKKTEKVEEDVIDGVNLIKLRRWVEKDCDLLVAKMIKFLYKQKKEISFEDLRDGIDYRGSDEQLKSNIRGGAKGQYGFLWSNKSYKFISINPNIKNFLDKL